MPPAFALKVRDSMRSQLLLPLSEIESSYTFILDVRFRPEADVPSSGQRLEI